MTKIFGISLVLMLSGCATMGQVVVSDYCQMSQIIRPSRKDTPETLRQIAAANVTYRTLCVNP